ncbi:DNA cytosine methyltransferase [Tardiphaga sp. 768_D3_N2_1]|uniref:DNA cytosine methyltransferase n=1 Tax=Tardiphaga sp. 768_D3_N2_1 TaxID=3240783 RepID=UPI003F8C5331
MQEQPRIVDLFSGCGGFSLGAHAVGLGPTLAFDVDPILTSSFSLNHPHARLKLGDLSAVIGADIRREIGGRVDGVFGGPPCQAFSSIGHRNANDPRRNLLGHFFRLVAELEPAFFVMENVKGLGYADARPVLDAALSLLPGRYKILGPLVLDAADFGAATRRPRLFVIGYDPDRVGAISEADVETKKLKPTTVRAAISDLATAVQIENDGLFDLWKIKQPGRPSDYAAGLRAEEGVFTGHKRTAHTPEVIKRFKKVEQGGVEAIGRHPRLSWGGQCPTLRAGTGNDRGSFQSVRPLHPEEPRVITVREAARLQGFPDHFRFHPTVWHSFRMIGNSVSPIMSKAIFSLIAERIDRKIGMQVAAE